MQQHKENLDDKSSQIKINVLDKAIFTLIKHAFDITTKALQKALFVMIFPRPLIDLSDVVFRTLKGPGNTVR